MVETIIFFSYLLIPIIIWLINKKLLDSQFKIFSISIISSVIIYIVFIVGDVIIQHKHEAYLLLNNNGVCSEINVVTEITKEMCEAKNNMKRTISPLFGLLISIMYASGSYAFLEHILSIRKWCANEKT